MELDTVFGVPAHPLFVHLPIVLVPLALVAGIVAVAAGRWRRWVAPLALALAVIASIGTVLGQESGEPLEERVERSRGETEALEEHTEAGENLLPFVLVFTGLLGAVVAVDLAVRSDRAAKLAGAAVPLMVVAVLAGGLATWQVVDIGHSGARAAWEDVLP